jgi:hypothetical protein
MTQADPALQDRPAVLTVAGQRVRCPHCTLPAAEIALDLLPQGIPFPSGSLWVGTGEDHCALSRSKPPTPLEVWLWPFFASRADISIHSGLSPTFAIQHKNCRNYLEINASL